MKTAQHDGSEEMIVTHAGLFIMDLRKGNDASDDGDTINFYLQCSTNPHFRSPDKA